MQPALGVFDRIKSVGDFEREIEEFNTRKLLQKQAIQKGALEIEAAKNPMPFQGTGFDQQIANEAYKFNINKGMDPETAKRAAIDMVLGTKQSGSMVTDPVTGQQSVQFMPRKPIFGYHDAQIQPVSMDSSGEMFAPSMGGQTPDVPLTPMQYRDPMAAHQAAVGAQQEQIGVSPMQRPDLRQPSPKPQKRLYDIAPLATGVVSGGLEAWAKTAGQVSGVPISEQALEARQAIQTESARLINALRQNPRFSEGERKSLEKQIELSPSVFDSPRALQARMRSIDQSLRTRLVDEQRAANDATLPVSTRQGALESVNAIRNFLEVLGVPQGNSMPSQTGGDINQLLDMYAPQ